MTIPNEPEFDRNPLVEIPYSVLCDLFTDAKWGFMKTSETKLSFSNKHYAGELEMKNG